jgi:translation elongation factor aEF-1 beta
MDLVLATPANLNILNNHLIDNSFVDGFMVTKNDFKVFAKLPADFDAATFIYIARWYNFVSAIPLGQRATLPADAKAAVAAYAAPAKPVAKKVTKKSSSSSSSSSSSGSDSSDSDSDSDSEDDEAKAKKAAYDAKTKANIEKEQSTVIFDIKPADVDVDIDALADSIYGITCDGLEWGREHQIIPLAFGLKMLKVACIIRNVKVSTDWMEEQMAEIEGVGSVEIAAFNKI